MTIDTVYTLCLKRIGDSFNLSKHILKTDQPITNGNYCIYVRHMF